MSIFNRKEKNESTETLGMRIAHFRKAKGYTQEEFSQLLGVTAQAVSKWENDLSCPDIMLLPKIAQLFEISTDELLGGASHKPTEEKQKVTLRRIFHRYSVSPHRLYQNGKTIYPAPI